MTYIYLTLQSVFSISLWHRKTDTPIVLEKIAQ